MLRPLPGPAAPAAELMLGWRNPPDNPACRSVLEALRQDWAQLCQGAEGGEAPPE